MHNQKMSSGEFAAEMAKLRANYQNAIADKKLWLASVDQYWQHLKQYPRSALLSMFARAWKDFPQWMPSAGQMVGLLEQSKTSAAVAAWPEVMKLARSSSESHSDPVARETIRLMGGGKRLGQMSEHELAVWGRKEFERIYSEVVEQTAREEHLQLGDGGPEVKQLVRSTVAAMERRDS